MLLVKKIAEILLNIIRLLPLLKPRVYSRIRLLKANSDLSRSSRPSVDNIAVLLKVGNGATAFKNESKIHVRPAMSTMHGIGLFCYLISAPLEGQAQNTPFSPPTSAVKHDQSKSFGFKSGSFIVAPIPFESPSIGSGLALGGAYLFKNDRLSDASTLAFGTFKSSNGSEGYGLGLSLSWDDDRWLMKFGFADTSLNFDVYPLGIAVPISQSLRGTSFGLAYSPIENYSFGGSLGYGEYHLNHRSNGILPFSVQRDRDLEIARLSAYATYDTRDDTIYPTTGTKLTGTLIQGHFLNLSRSSYSKAVISGSKYWSVTPNGVFAAHAVACRAGDNAPFFDSCSLGVTDSFRGYVSTEFLDDALTSVQAEYRGRLTKRIGFVAFAGAGSVGDDLSEAAGGSFKVAGGVGLRIRLSKTFPLDYAIDVSTNDRGEELLYISVGQRF